VKHKRQAGKGITAPCKSCRRRVRPELLDESFLCWQCRKDAAARWLSGKSKR